MKKLLALTAVFALFFAGCDDGNSADNGGNSGADSIKWDNEPDGTLEVQNNSSNDIVLFRGQLPAVSSILGGVRKSSVKTFDISAAVNDFNTGGYMIVRGMTIDEYNKNKSNLASAKIEYSAIVTYGQGRTYRVEINPVSFGNYHFMVTNTGSTGIELRKNSFDGEKISYIPPQAARYPVYTNSADEITVFPVYVYYDQTTKTLVTSNSIEDAVTVTPRPITDPSVLIYSFPVNPRNLHMTELQVPGTEF